MELYYDQFCGLKFQSYCYLRELKPQFCWMLQIYIHSMYIVQQSYVLRSIYLKFQASIISILFWTRVDCVLG